MREINYPDGVLSIKSLCVWIPQELFDVKFARSQSYNPPALPDAAKHADRLHTQRDSILDTPSG